MAVAARNVVAALTLLAFTGCAVVQPVEDLTPASIQRQVRPGDVVHVAVADGRTFELRLDKVEAAALTGTTVDGRRFRIAYASITRLQLRDPGQAAVGAGALIVLGTIAVIALLIGGAESIADEILGGDR